MPTSIVTLNSESLLLNFEILHLQQTFLAFDPCIFSSIAYVCTFRSEEITEYKHCYFGNLPVQIYSVAVITFWSHFNTIPREGKLLFSMKRLPRFESKPTSTDTTIYHTTSLSGTLFVRMFALSYQIRLAWYSNWHFDFFYITQKWKMQWEYHLILCTFSVSTVSATGILNWG